MTAKQKPLIYKAGKLKPRSFRETSDAHSKTPPATGLLPAGYGPFLADLKSRIRSAQIRASLASNREMIQLYWDIGKDIAVRQAADGWGAAVVDQLAVDLSREFTGIDGFSRTNLYRMRSFYIAWAEVVINVPQPVGQILPQLVGELKTANVAQPVRQMGDAILPQVVADLPWGQNITLLEKVTDYAERLWYANMAFENGWSRSILTLQIESDLFHRQGKAITNFAATLPPPQSDLAQQIVKDPYTFDFLTLTDPAREREVEEQLVGHVAKLLLEMGAGFAFVGRQFHLEVAEKDYYLDLLFYHTRLHCYVVVELKAGEFKPEYAGKLNFYLSAADDHIRQPEDKPTIGLLLCRQKDKIEVEYALRDMRKPIGVAEWQTKLVRRLPIDLRPSLPTVKEIETALAPLTDNPGAGK
jgi:predicted nuclease of restriction endonuclease-like (RecB) superfamily